MTRCCSKEAGFTLVEMLIALFIFSLISAGTMTALTGALSAKAQVKMRLAGISEIEVMRALIKADMQHMILRQNRDSFGAAEPYILSGGYDENLITFTRTGRVNPGGLQARSELQRVSYIFDGSRVIRRALPNENPAQAGNPSNRILMDGVLDFQIEFIKGNEILSNLSVPSAALAQAGQTRPFDAIRLRAEFKSGQVLDQYFEVGL